MVQALSGGGTCRVALLIALLALVGKTAGAAATRPWEVYLGSGADAYRMGDIVEATRSWGEAIRLCRLAGDKPAEINALSLRGEAFASLGQLDNALQDLKQALMRAEEIGDATQIAALNGALGNIRFQMRDLPDALQLLLRSTELARQQNALTILAASDNNLGNVFATHGSLKQAAEAYGESVAFARTAGDSALMATALVNLARVQLQLKQEDSAVTGLAEAIRAVGASPSSRDKVLALLSIGRLLMGTAANETNSRLTERRIKARQTIMDAVALADTLGDPRARSSAYGTLAELDELATNTTQARQLAHRAIQLAQQVGANDLLYRWEWLNGRLARSLGDQPAAIAAYRRAILTLESIRLDVPVEYTRGRSSFRESTGPLYYGLADLLLNAATQLPPESPAAQTLLIESRKTIETLKTNEIREYFHNQCLTRFDSATPAPERASATGTEHVAFIYPILLTQRIEILLGSANGALRHFVVGVGAAAVEEQARAMRRSLEDDNGDAITPSRRLYDWIIAPLKKELDQSGVDTLVVIPDGALRSIPFAALFDGKDYLIQHYAIVVSPSLRLTDLPNAALPKKVVLLSGISKSVQDFPPLPGVDVELKALQQIEPGAVLLENEQFRLDTAENALKSVNFTLMHIASHGVFGARPEDTFILTFDGRLTLDRLEQDIKYNQFRDQPLDLLVLSACQTAAGDDRAALGLAGAAVKSGARSVVASLWNLQDEAAARLVPIFYQRLAEGRMSKAQALRLAQLELMHNKDFQNPSLWSPFLLIGNWQ